MQSRERKILKNIFLGIIVLTIVLFTVFKSKNIIAGPRINIKEPLDGETVAESLVRVIGETKNISEIRLNGRNIFVDEEGIFREQILLSYGFNTIIVEAKDRFNREVKKELKLVFK